MKNEPLVSVVIPFFSERKWLVEAIESILNQTYSNIEILLINDGSKENVKDISLKYRNVKLINKENGGPASARNMGITLAEGKYIAFLDSDDIWFENKLSNQINDMEMNHYVWSHHSYEMFWENAKRKRTIDTSRHSGNVYRSCYISFKVQTSCLVVLREKIISENIVFPDDKRYGQDLDFYRQLAKRYPLGYVDGVYTKFRIRGSNAGFRAKVQLNDKRITWNEIRDNSSILDLLPGRIILAYKISYYISGAINIINNKLIKNENLIEMISKVGYIIPYVIFKSCIININNNKYNINI